MIVGVSRRKQPVVVFHEGGGCGVLVTKKKVLVARGEDAVVPAFDGQPLAGLLRKCGSIPISRGVCRKYLNSEGLALCNSELTQFVVRWLVDACPVGLPCYS